MQVHYDGHKQVHDSSSDSLLHPPHVCVQLKLLPLLKKWMLATAKNSRIPVDETELAVLGHSRGGKLAAHHLVSGE